MIAEAKRNDDKYAKRVRRSVDIYGYNDEFSSQFHRELCTYDETADEIKEKEIIEELREIQILLLREGMDSLTEVQRRRLKAIFFSRKNK